MAKGICVFAEHFQGNIEAVVAELVSVAHLIRETTKEQISAMVVSDDCEKLIEELKKLGLDEIYAVKTKRDPLFQDDAVSQVITDMLRRIDPSVVLVPATMTGRSIFSRVAVKLGCGLTADCTEVLVGTGEDGSFYIKQNKPSFGENVFVTIVTRPGVYPQMMTVRPGVYQPYEATGEKEPRISYLEVEVPESGIRVVTKRPAVSCTDSILGAETVVIAGRGAETAESFELLRRFAGHLDAAVGGTRPIADEGWIPFENQVGQTGCTIRPRICITLGVSGAIQHTEGIKDTKLMIAINQDEEAPIFQIADYGIVGDLNQILAEYLKEK